MNTRVSTTEELKKIFVEIFLNKTDRVTKVSDQSVVNGISYGIAKIGQKAIKDIALIESHLFPEDAHGIYLDQIAQTLGISPRFGASESSTFIRIFADEGTTYVANTNTFTGNGIVFELTQDITIGAEGYAYAKVRSQSIGQKTNVPSLSINQVSNPPSGHLFVTNEYESVGGRDIEDDVSFRNRIKQGPNIAATGTLQYIIEVFTKFNSNVLDVKNYGINSRGQTVLAIVTQNGIDLTNDELGVLLSDSKDYLALTEFNSVTNNSIGVELRNVEYQAIDIDFRAELIQQSDIDAVRQDIQVQISKYLDFRYWDYNQKVEWDNLLQIVKSDNRIKYVPDSHFTPNRDVLVQPGKLPRVRGFVIRDLDGNVIIDGNEVLDPVYYPTTPNQSFQQTIL